jgi:hypothetical protein
MKDWKRGLPPGKYYEGMIDDYEVDFSAGGMKWHRKRTEEEKQAHIAARERNRAAQSSGVREGKS